MKGMKRIMRIGGALVLSVAMILSPLPIAGGSARQVQAIDMPSRLKSNLRLGISNGDVGGGLIGAANNARTFDRNEIDHVYYGKYNGEPVKYRVIDCSTKDYNGSGDSSYKMLLHSETIVHKDFYAYSNRTNEWENSIVKKWLNGSGFLLNTNCFTAIEEGAIAKSYKGVTDWSNNGIKYYNDAINGEKVFVLNYYEAQNYSYAFAEDNNGKNNSRIKKYNNTASNWWLRTRQESSGNVWYVESDGSVNIASKNTEMGLCPAFAVDLSDVLFSYMVYDGNNTSRYGKDYKLTLRDDDIELNVSSIEADSTGNKLTIPYTVTGSNKGNVNRLSVLVLDKEFSRNNYYSSNIIDYRPLTIVSGNLTSGIGTVTFSANYTNTNSYYVYLIAEDINGTNETDYACTPVRLNGFHNWTISNSGQNIEVACSRHSNEKYTASISMTSKTYDGTRAAAGSITKSSGFPASVTSGNISYKGTGSTTYSESTLPPTNAGTYYAYAVFTDSAGNQKIAQKDFEITQKVLSDNALILNENEYEYDGTAKTPSIKVVDGNTELKEDIDYTINTSSVLSATEPNDYEIKVEGKGNYKGSAIATWKIKKSVAVSETSDNSGNGGSSGSSDSSGNSAESGNGSGQGNGGSQGQNSGGNGADQNSSGGTTDQNQNSGGNAASQNNENKSDQNQQSTAPTSGDQSQSSGIDDKSSNPTEFKAEEKAETVDKKQKSTSLYKLKAGKKSITISWKKQTAKGIKGYEIQYSTDKKFKKDLKIVTINKTKTTSKTIKKLKSKKKYYVRIRTYKKSGDEKVYSKWSKTKNVKVK